MTYVEYIDYIAVCVIVRHVIRRLVCLLVNPLISPCTLQLFSHLFVVPAVFIEWNVNGLCSWSSKVSGWKYR